MARVIDYAWGRPSIASLAAAGAVAVCRYLSYDHTGKNLTPVEAAVLTTAGIAIVSNWEAAGNWTEYSQGFAKGVQHAIEAQRQHLACGGPPDRPIYFSTDFNPTSGQLPTIADYYRGVASIIGLARTGAYGGYKTITYLFDQGVIRWGWQTYAWSDGRWDTRAQLRQVRNGVNVGGVDCDLNDSTTADFGQWGIGRMVDMDPQAIVPKTNGTKFEVVISDIWNALMTGHSGFVPENRIGIGAVVDAINAKLTPIALDAKAGASLAPTVTMTPEDRAAIVAELTQLVETVAGPLGALAAAVEALDARLAKAGHALTDPPA